MVKREIKWTTKAIFDKISILEYWIWRTKSKKYSLKLSGMFDNVISQLALNPESGKITDYKNIRFRIVKQYLIFYTITEKNIFIIRIWDSRRNPEDLRF